MKDTTFWVFMYSFFCLSVLGYSYYIQDMRHINWFTSICFWGFVFSSLFLLFGLFLKRSNEFYLLFFSSAFAVVLAEILLRFFQVGSFYIESRNGYYVSAYASEDRGWLHVKPPQVSCELRNVEYAYPRHTNSLGLSDVEFNKAKPAGSKRIICLGDSFTEGDGTAADSTWPLRLKHNILGQYPGLLLDVYNAGSCGSDPFYEYQLLAGKLLQYKPDMVIMAFNNSDIDDYIIRGGMERFKADSTTIYRAHPWYEFLMASSYVTRLIFQNAIRMDYNLMTADVRDKLKQNAVSDIVQVIGLSDSICKANGIVFQVLAHPIKFEYTQKSYYAIQPIIDSLNATRTIPVCDFLSFLKDNSAISDSTISDYYWKIDGHHNAQGYALMGDAVTDCVLSTALFHGGPSSGYYPNHN